MDIGEDDEDDSEMAEEKQQPSNEVCYSDK